jgi:hypothetical protein
MKQQPSGPKYLIGRKPPHFNIDGIAPSYLSSHQTLTHKDQFGFTEEPQSPLKSPSPTLIFSHHQDPQPTDR